MYPKKANGYLRICLDPKDLNKATILNGWPDRQGCVPGAARFYWSFCDKLSIDGNIITKGE